MSLHERLADMAVYARVVESGGFSAAALTLNQSKSAVSKAVSRLEAHLGTRLLNRSTRKLTPTEAGLAFHAYCREIVAQAEEAEQHIGQLRDVPRGLLKITSPLSLGVGRIALMLPEFLALHPEVRVSLVVDDRNLDLIGEGFDLALRIGKPPDSSLVGRKLAELHSLVVASPDYVAKHGAPRRPADLLRHNCLNFSERADEGQWHFTGPDGNESVQTQGQLMLNTSLGLRETALAGIGIAKMPDYLAAEGLADGRLLRLLPNHPCQSHPLYAIYPHREHLAAKVKAAIGFFQQAFGK
ncbi:LysR family transcriptional regulator [Paucibacter sp. B2R-40]|uniref:LysR family transcriptional regulator n=1 Tax=Paucibacter sp. B2R-40 TaxID=2893554 RepID=UPI0021E4BDDE|nr:LysR family transcriptional regulator [Paucibacter sp. B2R-40]MCV2353381.1 LysR family transcriptional regulator [Paucibacter sp. B2R-40]